MVVIRPSVIFNRTPHEVTVLGYNNEVLEVFPKSEDPIRMETDTVDVGKYDRIPISKTVFTLDNLEPEREGVYYIVSQLVKANLPHRNDLLVPAEIIRDDTGKILGCRSLGI